MDNSVRQKKMKKNKTAKPPRVTGMLVQRLFGSKSIKSQLYSIYFVALVVPIAVLGTFLVANTYRLLKNYYTDMVAADNQRVRSIFFEVTSQIYNMSNNIYQDNRVVGLLGISYENSADFYERADAFLESGSYLYSYSEIEGLAIYTENPSIPEYSVFKQAGENVRSTDWYSQAVRRDTIVWMPMEQTDANGNSVWTLCLVRRLMPEGAAYQSVLVIEVSDAYLRTRVESNEYNTVVGLSTGQVIYASDRSRYGTQMYLDIAETTPSYSYAGNMTVEGESYIVNIVTIRMYESDYWFYVCTLSQAARQNLRDIMLVCLILILAALVLPGVMIVVYTRYFTGRVDSLRGEMHKASRGDYHIMADFRGQDELSEAFADLQVMVEKIQEKEALMYQSQISDKNLENKQQEMEFKMLASQINPHFLYNTLETIRMSAFTAGDREVATAIKLLGKSLRYVLENTGTTATTLKSELDHVENYIRIQKLRFGERINYQLEVDEHIVLEDYHILPLLLQPIVENAILHGLEEKENDGLITLRVYLKDELHIEISDNGSGMTLEEVQRLRGSIAVKNPYLKASIGLYNINQRIKLCYGSRYGLRIDSVPGKGTTISLVIPANDDALFDNPAD